MQESTRLDRVEDEEKELNTKITKLQAFLETSTELHPETNALLFAQLKAMQAYSQILAIRILRENEQPEEILP